MPETNATIRVSAVGGDEAAAALSKAKGGLEGIGAESGNLEEKFSHRFSHIGLQLFAGDALRASGLGRETRQVIGTLQLAISSMGEAFGAAAGPVMLIVTALVAVYGIVEKVREKHSEHLKELEKVNKETKDQIKNTDDIIKSIKEYGDEIGYIPPELAKWRDAENALRQVQIQRQIEGDKAMVSSITQVMNASREKMAQMKQEIADTTKQISELQSMGVDTTVIMSQKAKLDELIGSYRKLGDSQIENKAKLEGLFVEIKRLSQGITESLADQTKAHKTEREESDKTGKQEVETMTHIAAGLSELRDKENEYNMEAQAASQVTANKKNALTDAWMNRQIDALNKIYEQEVSYANMHIKDTEELNAKVEELSNARNSAVESLYNAHNAKLITADSERYKAFQAMSKHAFDEVANAVGQSVAKMIVEGKSFTDSMEKAFKSMAEQIIADIIRIEIEWLILKSLGFAAGGVGGFLMAEGGSVLVTQPTMFMAGEAGQPEVATFTPLSKLGNNELPGVSTSGSNIQIGTIQTNVYGVTDPNDIADKVGMRIAERIRGQGEINFTRSF